ncbi:MAG TPA: helix-turn-helix domain-containing protein [Acidimicrobiales bacterium]|nr:helix-turn-helix domain-containing protein [Acidimicrobiales bacterium]
MAAVDTLLFGQRLRHLRRERGLTLDALGTRVGRPAPFLSLIENGRREPRLGLIDALAAALDVTVAELLSAEPPNRRASLEIAVQRAQEDPLYRDLGLPWLKPSAAVPDTVLEHVVGLYEALRRRAQVAPAAPEAARRANVQLRADMRQRDNYFAEIEEVAAEALAAVGYRGSGAVAERMLSDLVAHFGFTLHRVQDLPVSARAVTDLRHRCIYIHQRNALPTRAARSVVLQTLGHFALGHTDPQSFGDFLRQQVEANYFAGAVLAPERPAVDLLTRARDQRDLSVEDLKQVFYISYEMAAHRLTNLVTRHLGLPVHFLRADDDGVIWKAYENNGMPFPADADGVIEGQRACRSWGTRRAFGSYDQFAEHAQYTSTPAGEFWCITQVEVDRRAAVTVGARAKDARWFRGHETTNRATSRCPDGECCRRPPDALAARWRGHAWPLARADGHILATFPAESFTGVEVSEVYDFLERQDAPRPAY